MKISIYCLLDPETNAPKYIGKSKNVNIRYREHLRRSKYNKTKKDSWILGLIKKDKRPILEILEVVDSDYNANIREKYYIKLFKESGFELKNSTDGGDGNCNPTIETKLKISENHVCCKGINNPFFGKKHTEESLRKMRRKRKDGFSQKMSKIMIDKISRGESNFLFKKGKENISSKSVNCLTIEGILVKTYETIADASKDGFSPDCISKCIRGLNKTHKGFIFQIV